MKAWVQSLTTTQYMWLQRACNFGVMVLALVALLAFKNFLLWGVLFAFQMTSCYLLNGWRYGCNTCDEKHCITHKE